MKRIVRGGETCFLDQRAEKGNRHAYYDLASRYEEGKGTEVDYKEAYKWYRKDYELYRHIRHQWCFPSLEKMIALLEKNPGV